MSWRDFQISTPYDKVDKTDKRREREGLPSIKSTLSIEGENDGEPTPIEKERPHFTSHDQRMMDELVTRAQIAAPFDEIFRSACDEIYERYIDGTIEHTEKYCPDLCQRIDKADDRMMTAWQSGIEGKTGIEDFRKVVDEWKLLHFQAIEAYAKKAQ
jgi:hypothetical protein